MNELIIGSVIGSDEDAWNVLAAWVGGEDLPSVVEFDGWPKLKIAISGEDYSSSLNTRQMAAYVDFRKVMGRAYSSIAHGAYDARRLKAHEEEQLDLTTEVRQGSSLAETDFTGIINAFAQIITSHPNISLASAIVLGLLFVSRPIILQHLENRSKQIDSEERGKLHGLLQTITKEDRAKLKLLEKAVAKISKPYPQFAAVLPEATAAHWRLTASAANADRMTIGGINLQQSELEALSERRSSRNAVIDEVEDDFLVLGLIRMPKAFRVQLQSKTMHLSALYKAPQLTEARVKKLAACITSGQRVHARVELKTIENAHIIGRLLSFKPITTINEAQG